jgi:hypothetical protein
MCDFFQKFGNKILCKMIAFTVKKLSRKNTNPLEYIGSKSSGFLDFFSSLSPEGLFIAFLVGLHNSTK